MRVLRGFTSLWIGALAIGGLTPGVSGAAITSCATKAQCTANFPFACENAWPMEFGFNEAKTSVPPMTDVESSGEAVMFASFDGPSETYEIKFSTLTKSGTFRSPTGSDHPRYGTFLGSDLGLVGFDHDGRAAKVGFINFNETTPQFSRVEIRDDLVSFVGAGRVSSDLFYVHAGYRDPGETRNETGTRIYLVRVKTKEIVANSGISAANYPVSATCSKGILVFGSTGGKLLSAKNLAVTKSFQYPPVRLPMSVLKLTDDRFVLSDLSGAFAVWSEASGLTSIESRLPGFGSNGVLLSRVDDETFLSFHAEGADKSEKAFMLFNVKWNRPLIYTADGEGALKGVRVMPNKKIVAVDSTGMLFVWNPEQQLHPIRKIQLNVDDTDTPQKEEAMGLFLLGKRLGVVTSRGSIFVPYNVWN